MLQTKFCSPAEISASQPDDALRETLARETGIAVSADNLEVARSAKIILIGVKPSVVLTVVRELAPVLEGKLVISLAAGVRIANMEPLANARFMRVMTNLAAAVGEAATAFARGSRTTTEDVAQTKNIFSAIGAVVQVEERQIDAVTALAGSGPAFVYTVIEALAAGGAEEGLTSRDALALATQTLLGAARLVASSGRSPDELRRMVVTPGGTTAAGLAAMEKHRTSDGLAAAIVAAAERGREMARETA